MEKIASFQVNHLTLVPGVYVSRRDKVGRSQQASLSERSISRKPGNAAFSLARIGLKGKPLWQLRNRCARDKKDFLKQMQKAKNTGMNGHIAKSRDINKLSEILRKIFI